MCHERTIIAQTCVPRQGAAQLRRPRLKAIRDGHLLVRGRAGLPASWQSLNWRVTSLTSCRGGQVPGFRHFPLVGQTEEGGWRPAWGLSGRLRSCGKSYETWAQNSLLWNDVLGVRSRRPVSVLCVLANKVMESCSMMILTAQRNRDSSFKEETISRCLCRIRKAWRQFPQMTKRQPQKDQLGVPVTSLTGDPEHWFWRWFGSIHWLLSPVILPAAGLPRATAVAGCRWGGAAGWEVAESCSET